MRSRGVLLASGGVLALGLFVAPPAGAACHAFDVTVDPAEAAEGATVTVTITRDAAVNPSSVRVRTEDVTAAGGQDYEAVDRRVEFSTGTSQTFSLQVLQDAQDEPDETFRLRLSEGQGCQVNPNFTYGEATVTVVDDDPPPTTAPPPPTAAPSPGPTAAPTTTAAGAEDPDTADRTTTSRSATSVTTGVAPDVRDFDPVDEEDAFDDDVALDDDDDDGGGGGVAAAAAAAVLAAVVGGGYLWYRRSGAGT